MKVIINFIEKWFSRKLTFSADIGGSSNYLNEKI